MGMGIITDAELLKEVEKRFDKHENEYGLLGEDVEWLIKQAKQVRELGDSSSAWEVTAHKVTWENTLLLETFRRFETSMKGEIDWFTKKRDSDKRRQYNTGMLSGMRSIERQWDVACKPLKGGVQNGEAHKT